MSNTQQQRSLAVHQIHDDQHRMIVAALQHPVRWQAQSSVYWNYQHYTLPVKVCGRVFDPTEPTMLEFFPVEQFCWIEPNLGFYQNGQDLGDGTALLAPMSAADTMIRWI